MFLIENIKIIILFRKIKYLGINIIGIKVEMVILRTIRLPKINKLNVLCIFGKILGRLVNLNSMGDIIEIVKEWYFRKFKAPNLEIKIIKTKIVKDWQYITIFKAIKV